ncbi:nucleoside triphosphate pyrophosphohydrolase [Chromatiales bacterium (ex Bugula neritina AB1)]|nr:nucleoside triphosphate pyrophosphohydrolase [Chromatiales bacterium (ex Bugula neritina AB1)]
MEETRALLEIMKKLRDPKAGCPWDIKQTFESIAPYTIEEAYEVADAIEQNDMQALREELGDLLLQVVFHAQMASDEGLFDFEDVVKSINEKMVRRHPHVFGDTEFASEAEQKANWEELKQQERAQKQSASPSALDGVAIALPALTRAEKIQKRAARVGFDWPTLPPVVEKVDEELVELREAIAGATDNTVEDNSAIEDELGDLLFAVTNVARHLNVDPELALKRSTAKFEHRFRQVENTVNDDGVKMYSLALNELDQYWQAVKRAPTGRDDHQE